VRYRKENLIERYGADIRLLPDLREEIAQCERRGKYDACMVRYVDFWRGAATMVNGDPGIDSTAL
jgi:hypothetical protein